MNEEQERTIALEMGIPLFRRYSEKEAASLLGVSPATLQRIRFRGDIAYLHISERTIQYFGKHLVGYIFQNEKSPTEKPAPTPPHKPQNVPHSRLDKADILASARRSLGRKNQQN